MSKEIIDKFYKAFQQLDAETMASCYHENIIFHDPAFGELKGKHASNMWRMLCANQKGKGMKISYQINSDKTAHWEPIYTFSKTGRKVHNKIDAEFEFQDGLIIKHTDHFDLYRWSGQALGISGYLLGWTSFFRDKLRKQTISLLARFESNLP